MTQNTIFNKEIHSIYKGQLVPYPHGNSIWLLRKETNIFKPETQLRCSVNCVLRMNNDSCFILSLTGSVCECMYEGIRKWTGCLALRFRHYDCSLQFKFEIKISRFLMGSFIYAQWRNSMINFKCKSTESVWNFDHNAVITIFLMNVETDFNISRNIWPY